MLNATFALIVVLVALLALPWLLKWMQRKTGLGTTSSASGAQVLGAVALGPHQRLVTVEVGPPGARVRLELGVTPQAVTCLHSTPVDKGAGYAAVAQAMNAPKNIADIAEQSGAADDLSQGR